MPRGITPRRPSRSGLHARARVAPPSSGGRNLKPSPARKPAATPTRKIPRATTSSGYNPLAPDRIAEILTRLAARYPGATCALKHHNAWELLVATILSAQCTDVRVNLVTPELFRKYPSPGELAPVPPEVIEPEIRSTGFFRNKSKSITGAARAIMEQHGGKVPDTMEELLTLPGVARKTANVVLGTWFGKAAGVVVDTHVHRISRRLELTKNDDPRKIEEDLMRVIPREKWTAFAHQLIHHGRQICVARKPKCVECPLEDSCHAADKTWSTVPIHKSAKP